MSKAFAAAIYTMVLNVVAKFLAAARCYTCVESMDSQIIATTSQLALTCNGYREGLSRSLEFCNRPMQYDDRWWI